MLSQAVFMLEDDPSTQERLSLILQGLGMPVPALHKAASIQEAKALLPSQPWSLALVDMGLPDGHGIEIIECLHHQNPELPIVVVSAWSTRTIVLGALQAGACGYVLKERDDFEVALALRSVLRGGAPIDPFIARGILDLLPAMPPQHLAEAQPPEDEAGQHATSPPLANPLSKRENQILVSVAGGLSNREIAQNLALAKETVESHIRSIYRKLGVNSRTKALFTARAQGWFA